jgi:probable rRNA maturation factor
VVEEGGRSPGAKGLGRWLTRIAPSSARGLVTVAILPDGKVRALNRKYRRKDASTDVLSFPGEAAPGASFVGAGGRKHRPEPFLGDIAISRGIAQKQAKLLGHSLRTEFRVLALHGLLHLLGYDHESDAGRMARVEGRLRRQGGLPVGLIARTARARRSRVDR